jgi:hypothetical protein
LALEQFHGDERTAFEFTNIVNRADVRVIQRGCRARFAAKALDGLRILGNIVGQEFQRDIPIEEVSVIRPRSLPQRLNADKRASRDATGLNSVHRDPRFRALAKFW